MLLAMAARRMERVTDRQRDLGAVYIKRDAAQLLDRSRGGHRLVQTERFEHRLCPVEQPLVALCIGPRVGIGVWWWCRNRQLDRVNHAAALGAPAASC